MTKLSEAAQTADKFLSQGYNMDKLINQMREAYESATSVTARLNDMPVQISRQNSSENKFIKYSASVEKIRKELEKLEMIYDRIINVINRVDNNQYKAYLYARYINSKPREEIAEDINVSVRWLDIAIRPKALEAVAVLIKNNRT